MERKYSVESNYGNVEFSRMHTLEKLQTMFDESLMKETR